MHSLFLRLIHRGCDKRIPGADEDSPVEKQLAASCRNPTHMNTCRSRNKAFNKRLAVSFIPLLIVLKATLELYSKINILAPGSLLGR